MCKVIDKMADEKKSGAGSGIASASNDGYSVTFANATKEAGNQEMAGCIRQWLSGTGMVGAY